MRNRYAASPPATIGARASPLARSALVAYLLLMLYASFTPFAGWRASGAGAFDFLPVWPRYLTRFDLLVNVMGYLPLGALGVLALHPRVRGGAAILLATSAAFALSVGIEAVQTFLPQRVASSADLLTNSVGALLGAAATAPYAAGLIDRGRLAQWRHRHFTSAAAPALVLLALWPLAQAHPTPLLFGPALGDGFLLEPLRALGAHFLPARGTWGPGTFQSAETIVTTAALLTSGLALASVMRPGAPRLRLLAGLICATLAAKALFYGLRFGPEQLFAWATEGALMGLAVSALALAAAAQGSPRATARVGLAAGVVLLVLLALIPQAPDFADWTASVRAGRMLHFYAAARWLALAWPFALVGWLLLRRLQPAPT